MLTLSRILPNRLIPVTIERGPLAGLIFNLYRRGKHQFLPYGIPEVYVSEYMVSRLRPGMTVYDLGANFGLFTLLAARAVGPAGHVYAFEPEPMLLSRLEQNIRDNRMENVTVVPRAVWKSSGKIAFERCDPRQSMDMGLGKVGVGHYEVTSVSLDDFARDNPPPAFIKIDVEGAEGGVLQGAARLLSAHKPEIMCEMHSLELIELVTKILTEHGYKLHWLADRHVAAVI